MIATTGSREIIEVCWFNSGTTGKSSGTTGKSTAVSTSIVLFIFFNNHNMENNMTTTHPQHWSQNHL